VNAVVLEHLLDASVLGFDFAPRAAHVRTE
jgi:hypothetical protein